MRVCSVLLAVFTALFGWAGLASAADIARLEWGGFVVEDDSSAGWESYKSLAADDGGSISLTFTSLGAKADGAKSEDRAWFGGHYEVSQPTGERFNSLTATVQGFIIKSEAGTARLVVKVGSFDQVIEWGPGKAVSEKFQRDIAIPVSAGGQLPTPLAVRIETFASKGGGSDAAYVSVESLVLSTAATRMAEK